MCIFKRNKPLEYEDIKYFIRFNFFADEDRIRRILNVFVNAIKESNKTIDSEENKIICDIGQL